MQKEISDADKRNEAIVHDQQRMTQSIEDVRAQRKPIEETLDRLREDLAAYEKIFNVLIYIYFIFYFIYYYYSLPRISPCSKARNRTSASCARSSFSSNARILSWKRVFSARRRKKSTLRGNTKRGWSHRVWLWAGWRRHASCSWRRYVYIFIYLFIYCKYLFIYFYFLS